MTNFDQLEDGPLTGTKVAFLVANGFDEVQFTDTQRALLKAGAKLTVVSPENGLANGWHDGAWGHYFPVDQAIDAMLATDFDILFVPGGPAHSIKLAKNPHTARIIGTFLDGQKKTVMVNEGVTLLAAAERMTQRTVSVPAKLAEDVAGNGGNVADGTHSVDGELLTLACEEDFAATLEIIMAFMAGEDTNGTVQEAA